MGRKKKEILIPPPCDSVHEYEQSDWWKNKTKLLLENKDAQCPFCGRRRWIWQPRKKQWKRSIRFVTHHQTYENVPYEKEEDLILACWQCHDLFHAILRLEKMSPIFKQLSDIVRQYFRYDTGSASRNNYLNGIDKNGRK